MSYARFGTDSDLYVYTSVSGWIECCWCRFGDSFHAHSTDEMVAHVRAHIAAGHNVPPTLISDLEADREENDSFIVSKT